MQLCDRAKKEFRVIESYNYRLLPYYVGLHVISDIKEKGIRELLLAGALRRAYQASSSRAAWVGVA